MNPKEKVLVGTLIAAKKDGKILLIKRVKPPYVGFWSLPGGKIEFAEHVEDCALREFKEETGIDSDFKSVRGILSEVIHDGEKDEHHFVMFICEVEPNSSDFVESSEGKLKWFDLNDLPKSEILCTDFEIIKDFIVSNNEIKINRSRVRRDGEVYDLEEFL